MAARHQGWRKRPSGTVSGGAAGLSKGLMVPKGSCRSVQKNCLAAKTEAAGVLQELAGPSSAARRFAARVGKEAKGAVRGLRGRSLEALRALQGLKAPKSSFGSLQEDGGRFGAARVAAKAFERCKAFFCKGGERGQGCRERSSDTVFGGAARPLKGLKVPKGSFGSTKIVWLRASLLFWRGGRCGEGGKSIWCCKGRLLRCCAGLSRGCCCLGKTPHHVPWRATQGHV